jgi:hypothetical protein
MCGDPLGHPGALYGHYRRGTYGGAPPGVKRHMSLTRARCVDRAAVRTAHAGRNGRTYLGDEGLDPLSAERRVRLGNRVVCGPATRPTGSGGGCLYGNVRPTARG